MTIKPVRLISKNITMENGKSLIIFLREGFKI